MSNNEGIRKNSFLVRVVGDQKPVLRKERFEFRHWVAGGDERWNVVASRIATEESMGCV